ncbi:MAG TPA: YggT family protein [Oscillospiraceae bacterium]|nr:YggT family protein [Oscillospiraceae bacterium]
MLQAVYVADWFFKILNGMLFVRVILSWLPHNPQQPLIRLLYEGTEPLLAPFRRLIPRTALPIDLSPILAYLVLGIVRNLVISTLLRF